MWFGISILFSNKQRPKINLFKPLLDELAINLFFTFSFFFFLFGVEGGGLHLYVIMASLRDQGRAMVKVKHIAIGPPWYRNHPIFGYDNEKVDSSSKMLGSDIPSSEQFASPVSIWACYDKQRKVYKEYGYGHGIFWCALHNFHNHFAHKVVFPALRKGMPFPIAYGVLFVCFNVLQLLPIVFYTTKLVLC